MSGPRRCSKMASARHIGKYTLASAFLANRSRAASALINAPGSAGAHSDPTSYHKIRTARFQGSDRKLRNHPNYPHRRFNPAAPACQHGPKNIAPGYAATKIYNRYSLAGCNRLAFRLCAKPHACSWQQYNFDYADILHSSIVNIGLKITALTTYPASDWNSRHKGVAPAALAVRVRLDFAAASLSGCQSA